MSLAQRIERSWQQGGPLQLLLRPLSWIYAALSGLHRLLYVSGLRKRQVLPVPVIIVGNLIVGGAGKTPTVLALLQLLQGRGLRVGVISRGYGRRSDEVQVLDAHSTAAEVGDEPLLIHRRSGAPVAVGRSRVAAARALLASHRGLQLIISDDGLQHLPLPRALKVLVFDARGLGNGRLLPAGPLRELAPALLPADTLVLYNAERPSTHLAGYLGRRRLAGAVALADWWQGSPASLQALEALRGRPLLATAGMAQPQRFFDMLIEAGLQITPLPLPDHHDFSTLPWPAGTADVMLTEKDAVKIRPEAAGATRIWVVALDFQPEPAFEPALLQALQPHLKHRPG
ncbi:MAG: tetraacyldisaccharide 4'-kinase [Burkholderiaceae bacterium]|nr:tetraacyldisaccharide 4'-kinase [Burkholderiaceae bacterium]